jgi:hypothetical protein
MNPDLTSGPDMPVVVPPWGGVNTIFTPPSMDALAGEFSIMTDPSVDKGRFLTAVKGGGQTTDVIHTDAIFPQAWETFRFSVDSATGQFYAFQTVNGELISANDGGGLTANTIFTTATSVGPLGWELFSLVPQFAPFDFAIQTVRGFFLTAVGGGGHNSGDTIHTDALKADTWERFVLFRRGDMGTGSTYGIINSGSGNVVGLGAWLVAVYGGGQSGPDHVLSDIGAVPYWISWTLLNQDDGTYAFQTSSGNVLTANGGGIPGEGFRTDKLPYQIGDWEKFTLVDDGYFTAFIKTHVGTFISDVYDPNTGWTMTTVADATQATRWRFWVFNLRS